MTATEAAGRRVAERARRQRLLDVYGALLTDHQRQACQLYLDEDWSFQELGDFLACTRSGAHDLVRRSLALLDHYEARLGHAAELSRRDAVEGDLRARLKRERARRTDARV